MDGGDGGGDGDVSVSVDNIAQMYAEALCTKNFECCDAHDLEGATMSGCVQDNVSVLATLVDNVKSSQARGRASYDPSTIATCVDSLKAMSCAEFKQQIGENFTACLALILPEVAMGGACTQPYECTTGNCSGADMSVDPPLDGTCAAAPVLASINSSCAASDCVSDAYCDSATSTCQPKKAAGGACASSDECITSCDPMTHTCSCYAGCHVAAADARSGSVSACLLMAASLLVARRRRRRASATP